MRLTIDAFILAVMKKTRGAATCPATLKRCVPLVGHAICMQCYDAWKSAALVGTRNKGD
jgi:hypothetical protein